MRPARCAYVPTTARPADLDATVPAPVLVVALRLPGEVARTAKSWLARAHLAAGRASPRHRRRAHGTCRGQRCAAARRRPGASACGTKGAASAINATGTQSAEHESSPRLVNRSKVQRWIAPHRSQGSPACGCTSTPSSPASSPHRGQTQAGRHAAMPAECRMGAGAHCMLRSESSMKRGGSPGP